MGNEMKLGISNSGPPDLVKNKFDLFADVNKDGQLNLVREESKDDHTMDFPSSKDESVDINQTGTSAQVSKAHEDLK
jgi:hypothetical protein